MIIHLTWESVLGVLAILSAFWGVANYTMLRPINSSNLDIKKSIDRLTDRFDQHEHEIREIDKRVTLVESDYKAEHKRLDRHEDLINSMLERSANDGH